MRKITTYLLAIAIIIGMISSVSAAEGFRISPVRFDEEIDPGASISRQIEITNSGNSPVTTEILVQDFVAKDESGKQVYVEPTGNEAWAMDKWVEFTSREFDLAAGETKKLDFKINVPADAEPGGHYGTIFFQPKMTEGGNIGAYPRVGALLLIKVKGNITEHASVESFELPAENITNDAVTFVTRIKNNGNVHILPTGRIELYDETGKLLENVGQEPVLDGQGNIVSYRQVNYLPFNIEGGRALPGQIRRYETIWQREGSGGKIKAELKASYGDSPQDLQGEIKFDIKEDVAISKFTSDKEFYLAAPINFSMTVKNQGNIDILPQAQVILYNLFGAKKAEINLDVQKVMRDYLLAKGVTADEKKPIYLRRGEEVVLQANYDKLPFGLYTASLFVQNGDKGATVERQIRFYGASSAQLLITLIVLILIILIIILIISKYRRMKKMLKALKSNPEAAILQHQVKPEVKEESEVVPLSPEVDIDEGDSEEESDIDIET